MPLQRTQDLDEVLHLVLDVSKTKRIKRADLIDRVEETVMMGNVDFEVTCFFLLLFNGLLMSHTSLYISARDIDLVYDLDLIGRIDWCQQILNNVMDNMDKKGVTNPTMFLVSCKSLISFHFSCVKNFHSLTNYACQVFFLDNVDFEGFNGKNKFKVPWMNYYTPDMVDAFSKSFSFSDIKVMFTPRFYPTMSTYFIIC